MKHNLGFIIVFLILSSISHAYEVSCRGGGDGPTPFINISGELAESIKAITTNGEVLDFIHWPQSQSVVYRNEYGKLRKLALTSGKDRELSNFDGSLSPLVDPKENYVLTTKSNWYLKTDDSGSTWGKFDSSVPVVHLFWHYYGLLGKSQLYSISDMPPTCSEGYQEINIFKFTAGTLYPDKCHIKQNPDEFYFLGSGHQYPYAFLFKSRETFAGTYLSLYRINVNSNNSNCDLEKVKEFDEPIPGEIKSVHQYPDGKTFAVVTQLASTKKLYWDSPKTPKTLCDFGDRDPVLLNERLPVVAGWNRDEGITLVFPEKKALGTIDPELLSGDLRKRDIKLSNDGKKLFVNNHKKGFKRELSIYDIDAR